MTALSHTASVKVLEDLLGRLEAAEGYDSRLTADIICALLAPPGSFVVSYDAVFTAPNNIWCDDGDFGDLDPYDIMWSRDAALALVERALPGCKHEIGDTRGKPWCALFPADRASVRVGLIGFNAYAATEPTAVLCALVTTLIANADSAGPQDDDLSNRWRRRVSPYHGGESDFETAFRLNAAPLLRRIEALEAEVRSLRQSIFPLERVTPLAPMPELRPSTVCPTCGIDFKGATGYVCPSPICPTQGHAT